MEHVALKFNVDLFHSWNEEKLTPSLQRFCTCQCMPKSCIMGEDRELRGATDNTYQSVQVLDSSFEYIVQRLHCIVGIEGHVTAVIEGHLNQICIAIDLADRVCQGLCVARCVIEVRMPGIVEEAEDVGTVRAGGRIVDQVLERRKNIHVEAVTPWAWNPTSKSWMKSWEPTSVVV